MTQSLSLTGLSATVLIQQFKRRETSPRELIDACIDRIESINPLINAVTATCFDRARDEAKNAERRYQTGTAVGPLDGLALGVKDLQPTQELLTTSGSPTLRHHVPQADLPMVARLRAAGAIVLGKTNVPEFGAGGNSRNPVWGATGNPFDPNRIAGGSSGGSAAALAADMLPICTGSDTGGSLRLPAALCGIVGFRPSPSMIAHPTRPLGWSGISVLGPMTRTIDDLLLVLESCAGSDPDDPLSAPFGHPLTGSSQCPEPADLSIGYSEDFGDCPVDPAVRRVFRDRITRLSGIVRECRPIDLGLGNMDRCFDVLRAESFVAAFAPTFRNAPDTLSPDICANVEMGLQMTLADRAWAHLEQTRILRAYNRQILGLDLIITPTAPLSPFAWIQSYATQIDGRRMDTYYRWLALTYRATLTGCPSITVPCGLDEQGFPFGLQMLGPVNGDVRLLSAARALETVFEADTKTARPRADMATISPSTIDLRSIVTHPPAGLTAGPSAEAMTAV